MPQQPWVEASDERVASMVHRGGGLEIATRDRGALISGLPLAHSSTFGKLPHISLPALRDGRNNQAWFFRAGNK